MKRNNAYGRIGLVGLAIQVAINLVALLAFKKNAAEFFSEQWWATWFPGYTVWLICVVLGFTGCGGGKNGTGQP